MRKSAFLVLLLALLILPLWARAASEYRLGPEDDIVVTVLRHEEFSGEFLVPQDGMVDLPAVGMVKASGMTLNELSNYITKRLGDRLRAPEVSVTLKTQGIVRVYVLGSVRLPGVYNYKPGWRITECIAAAGGNLGEITDLQASLVKGSTGEQKTVKLVDAFTAGSDANLSVDPGDVINIETVRTLPVYVTGKVRIPGLYKLRTDGGLLEAITLAGGTLDGAALSSVTVTHVSGESETVDLLPLMKKGDSSGNRKLEPGDLVVVPQSDGKIAVLGNVLRPGYFPINDGDVVRLTDALALAGGAIRQGNMEKVLLISIENGQEKKQICNVTKFLKSGDVASNPVIKPGDIVFVDKNGRTDWPSVLNSLSVTTLIYNVLTR